MVAGQPLGRGRDRRKFVRLACVVAALLAAISLRPENGAVRAAASGRTIRAVAFDYLALFDAGSIADDLERMLPAQGQQVATLWRTRQFEYCWLRSLTGRYADFSRISAQSLDYAAEALHAPLTRQEKAQLLESYSRLPSWPETPAVLRALKEARLGVIGLANFTPAMMRDNAANAGLTALFDGLVSSDERRTYKPDPRAYQLGVDHLHLAREEILFVASAGWDAAGAKSFGYPTFWVNRSGLPAEALGATADGTGPDLAALIPFVLERARPR